MDFVLSELSQQVMAAHGAERPIVIRGGGTKAFFGEASGQPDPSGAVHLDISGYHGVINYHPPELVITVKAGTLLSTVEETLAEQGQMLAFEPPRFGPGSTIGGCVAAGLSGPRRMAVGSLRDFILGAKLLDGSGQVLSFGGEVMKNVAGYDVSRLLAGSMGIFGALVELSIKVLPRPFAEETIVFSYSQAQALEAFNQWRSKPLPVSATAWLNENGEGRLYVRLSGSTAALQAARRALGGETVDASRAEALWNSLRDHTHPFLANKPLWRVALPPHTPALDAGETLIEWNGGQRWLSQVDDPARLRHDVARLGGHATYFRRPAGATEPYFHPLSDGLKNLSWRVKQELDPVGLFNPKRLFPDF